MRGHDWLAIVAATVFVALALVVLWAVDVWQFWPVGALVIFALELDHNVPRSDGGITHISNRLLLCSPCNRAKSNTLTLTGLRQLNQRKGWMAKS